MTSVTIPNSVTTIGDWVFSYCTNLTSVTIPNSVTSIGHGAFDSCSSLTNLTLGNNVITIGDWAFSCTSLTSVTIPNSVTSIGSRAFESCSSLTDLYFWGNTPQAGGSIFDGAGNLNNYYLPGTIGWSNSFAGRPTAIWQLPYPVIVGSTKHFGIKTNAFDFRFSWATNATVVVEATTNLASWTPVATNTITMGIDPLTDGWSYFTRSRLDEFAGPLLPPSLTMRRTMKTKSSLSRTPSQRTTVGHLRTVCASRILPLLLLFALPAAVQAQCYTYVTNNGTITITGYTCSGRRGDHPQHDQWLASHPNRKLGVLCSHQPDQRHDPQQRHQHRRRCVLFLHQPDQRHHPQQRHQHRDSSVLSLHQPDQRHHRQQRHQHRGLRRSIPAPA